jgi:hypothetical protein
VIVDPSNPISPPETEDEPPAYSRLAASSRSLITQLPATTILTVLIPLWIIIFLINSGIQTLRSNRRIRLHDEGKAGILVGNYRIPLMVEDMSNVVESTYNDINDDQRQEYLTTGMVDTLGEDAKDASDAIIEASPSPSPTPSLSDESFAEKLSSSSESSLVDTAKLLPLQLDFPTLALASHQFDMIKSLNNVGFRKYRVHIHKVRHSHAAIIVRMDRKGFAEGRTVIKHWLDEEFQL